LAARNVWGDAHEVVGVCEIDKYCQKVLSKHWPSVPIYEDVRELDAEQVMADATQKRSDRSRESGPEWGRKYTNGSIDLITGGFPCQPFSHAGKRLGTADERDLWPGMYRIIKDVSPRWVVGENVHGFLTWNGGVVFDRSIVDLEAAGYEVWPYVLPACGVGAWHKRDRVWIVAHRNDPRNHRAQINTAKTGADAQRRAERCREDVANSNSQGLQGVENNGGIYSEGAQPENEHPGRGDRGGRCQGETQSRLGRGFNGVSSWLDGSWERGVPRVTKRTKGRADRLKGLGNAIVSAVAEQIFRTIRAYDET